MMKYLLIVNYTLVDYTEPGDIPSSNTRYLGEYNNIEDCYKKARLDLRELAQEEKDPYGTILDPNDEDYDADEAKAVEKDIEEYLRTVKEHDTDDLERGAAKLKCIVEHNYDYGDYIDISKYIAIRID